METGSGSVRSALPLPVFTTRGAPGNMDRAASPRHKSRTGGKPQSYIAFFYSHNTTLFGQANANRFRFLGDFFNTPGIAPHGFGADPFLVEGMRVEKINLP